MAVPDGLQLLVDDEVIDGIHGRLMSGKEASVFVVGFRGAPVAAKVYKARERRTFKATSSYTEGRNQTRNTRDKRAMAKRSSYGRELAEDSWREMEYRALLDAFHGGVRVPKPFMLYGDVLLMELVVDAGGAPAPRLADFELAPEDAERMLREIHEQARLLLATGRVHGDLSAFNVLIAHDGPTIIDLPQVVEASGNNKAREILHRDLRNIAEHLARYDARLLRFRDAGEALWQHFQRGTLDRATEPQAGSVHRKEGPQGGRRAALAEAGRMNRGAPRSAGPIVEYRREPGASQPERPAQGRPAQGRPTHTGPRREGPPPAPRHGPPAPRRSDGGPGRDRPQQGSPRHERPMRESPPPGEAGRMNRGAPRPAAPIVEYRRERGAPPPERPAQDRPAQDRSTHAGPRREGDVPAPRRPESGSRRGRPTPGGPPPERPMPDDPRAAGRGRNATVRSR